MSHPLRITIPCFVHVQPKPIPDFVLLLLVDDGRRRTPLLSTYQNPERRVNEWLHPPRGIRIFERRIARIRLQETVTAS